MADANQLKIEARRQEAAGDYEQASRLYLQALSAMDEGGNLSDPSLLVRVADLEYRQDDEDSALEYYLQAVDEYAEQGLITNAIAVCNKILRVFPDQVDCHRRLADLHMDVGLTAEARQNLLRFAEEAWDPDEPGPVLEAMRTFLDRTPDQEVALRLASRLQEIGRDQEALDALKAVWEERTRAGADVESLKRKARTIHSGARVEEWPAGGEDEPAGPEEPSEPVEAGGRHEDPEPSEPEDQAEPDVGADPAGPSAGEESPAAGGREPRPDADPAAEAEWAKGLTGGPAGDGPDEPGDEAGEGGADAGESWTRAAAELGGADWETGSPRGAGGRERAGDERPRFGNGREAWGGGLPDLSERQRPDPGGADDGGAGAPDRELELVASYRERFTEFRRSAGADGPESPAPTAGGTQSPADTTERPADEDERAQREEEIMEELNELDRAGDVATAGSGGWDEEARREEERRDDEEQGPPSASAGEGPPDMPSPDDELGEEAELRRGLELVDEMLEVQPDNLDLRERKLRYARRLGDREVLVDASLQFADALAKDGARRSARALYRRVLELDPGNQPAESGLARLDVGELEEKRQAGKRAGADRATREAASPEEEEARRDLGMRLWTEFENSIREMPWLHAATQAYQATGPDALPPLETFEMLAHYLMARERYRDAADILERSLELADEGDEKVADVLYYLGRAYEKLGEQERADRYFDRLESVDPDFARVRESLSDAEGA